MMLSTRTVEIILANKVVVTYKYSYFITNVFKDRKYKFAAFTQFYSGKKAVNLNSLVVYFCH